MVESLVLGLSVLTLFLLSRRWIWLTPLALLSCLGVTGWAGYQLIATLGRDPKALKLESNYDFEFGGVYSLEVQRHKKDGHKIAFAKICNQSQSSMRGSEFDLSLPDGSVRKLSKPFELASRECQNFQWPLGTVADGSFKMKIPPESLSWERADSPFRIHWRWDDSIAQKLATLSVLLSVLIFFGLGPLKVAFRWIHSAVVYWIPVQEKSVPLRAVAIDTELKGRPTPSRQTRVEQLRRAIEEAQQRPKKR